MLRGICAGLTAFLLAGCATAPPTDRSAAAPPNTLATVLDDTRFGAPTEPIDADRLFDLDPAMRRFLAVDLAPSIRRLGRQNGLVDALYRRDALQLRYDPASTRPAAETFALRRGNCLSLVIMTAAFAKHLGLPTDYRAALIEDSWSRRGGLFMASGHVNITLGQRLADRDPGTGAMRLTIDFLPPEELRGLRTRQIDESTLTAMYLNNRAAEALAQHSLDNAYAWARAAVRQAPDFASAYNTLGAIYRQHGDVALGIQAFRATLALSPNHMSAMANLAQALTDHGQPAEAASWTQRLAALEAYPPFHDLRQGWLALERSDWRAAQAAFDKEIRRSGSASDLHHWAALAAHHLGDVAEARRHLQLAVQHSPTVNDKLRYAGKLNGLGKEPGSGTRWQ